MNLILLQTLVEALDVITEYDRSDYVALEAPTIERVSKKAVLIDGIWVPKSLLRTDFDSVLYVADWFYGKEFEK